MSDLPAPENGDNSSLSWDLGRTAARLVGYGWDEINGFLNGQTQQAQDAGYSQPEINAYLGKADPQEAQNGWAADWGVAKAEDHPAFADLAKAPDAPVSPLEAPGAARIADHAGVAAPPVAMPADGAPAPDTPIDFNTPEARNSYADAILSGAVSSPRDFAERYSGAFLGNADDPTDAHTAAVTRAAGNLTGSLPSDEDLTDTAIAIAHSASIELTPDSVKTVKNNVADQWAQDGRPLMELYQKAANDPDLQQQLVATPTPVLNAPERVLQTLMPTLDVADLRLQFPSLPAAFAATVAGVKAPWEAPPSEVNQAFQELYRDHPGPLTAAASSLASLGDVAARSVLSALQGLTAGGYSLLDTMLSAHPDDPEEAARQGLGILASFPMGLKGSVAAGLGSIRMTSLRAEEPPGAAAVPLPILDLAKIEEERGPVHAEAARIAQIAPEDREAELVKLDEKEAAAGQIERVENPIEAYHASPHEFDRFSTEHMGTGEGTQFEGAGLYFTESPKAHQHYLEQFSNSLGRVPSDFDASQLSEASRSLLDVWDPGTVFAELKLKDAEAKAGRWPMPTDDELNDIHYFSNLDWDTQAAAHSYRVNLHLEPETTIDRDLPLNEQPSAIQKILLDLDRATHRAGSMGPTPDLKTSEIIDQSELGKLGQKGTADFLAQRGIRGLKYLGNEGKGPYHNYVVFNEKHIEELERNGQPIKRADVEDLVPSYEAAQGFYKYAKSLVSNVLGDESGVLNLPAWRTPQQAAEKVAADQARWDAQKSIITNVGRNEQSNAQFAQQLNNFQGLLTPHIAEFEREMKLGPAGNPMGTTIGQFIDYIENRSTGVTLANSKLQPVADAIRDVNDVMKQRLQAATETGLLGPMQYRDNYFRHLWKDPRGPQWDDMWAPGVGKQGSGQSLQQRTLPTIADGLRAGLALKITNPIDLSLYDLGQKSRYLTALQIADEAKTAGHAYYAMAPKNPGDAPLTGIKSTIPIAPDVGTMKLYGADGFHQSYNNWLSNGMFSYPASATAYERAQWIANMSTGLKLALPTFHARVTGLASLATGFAQSMDELGRGEIGAGALHLAETSTGLPRIFNDATTGWRAIGQFTGAGSRWDKLFPSSLDNKVIGYLRDAGLRMGPRQSVYKLGSESFGVTARRGMAEGQTPWENAVGASREIVKAIGGEFAKIAGDPQTEALGKRLGMAPVRTALAPLNVLGRTMQTATSPLFDHWIPALKTGGAYRRLSSWLEANPMASEEAKWTQARQIAKDMDNRFGELNQDTLFYPRMAKQIANLAMLSDTWSYGTYRGMLGLLNIGERGGLKYNPVYGNTLVGSMAAYVMLNGVEQYVRTGQTPYQTDTPIQDFLAYRTGGVDIHGRPERGAWPAEVKEYFDLAKILATGIAGYKSNGVRGVGQVLPASADYALGKLNPAWEALRAVFKGSDAIGNFIFASPHTFDAFMKGVFDPIFLDAVAKEKKGSNFGLWSALTGDRQAPVAANWSDYIDQMTKVFDRNKKQQESREKRENAQLVNPDPNIAAPATRGQGGGRGGLSQRAERGVENYFGGRTEAGGGGRTSLYDPYVRAAAEEHYRAQARGERRTGIGGGAQPGEPTVIHGATQGEHVIYRDRPNPVQRGQNAYLRAIVRNEQIRRQRTAQREYMRQLREQGLTLQSQQP